MQELYVGEDEPVVLDVEETQVLSDAYASSEVSVACSLVYATLLEWERALTRFCHRPPSLHFYDHQHDNGRREAEDEIVSTTDEDEGAATDLQIAHKRSEVATLTRGEQQIDGIEELQGWLHKVVHSTHAVANLQKEWAKRWIVTKTEYEMTPAKSASYFIVEYLPSKGPGGARGERIPLSSVQSCSRVPGVDEAAEFEVEQDDGTVHRYRCSGIKVVICCSGIELVVCALSFMHCRLCIVPFMHCAPGVPPTKSQMLGCWPSVNAWRWRNKRTRRRNLAREHALIAAAVVVRTILLRTPSHIG
jgi:hypothetical protein